MNAHNNNNVNKYKLPSSMAKQRSLPGFCLFLFVYVLRLGWICKFVRPKFNSSETQYFTHILSRFSGAAETMLMPIDGSVYFGSKIPIACVSYLWKLEKYRKMENGNCVFKVFQSQRQCFNRYTIHTLVDRSCDCALNKHLNYLKMRITAYCNVF